MAATVAFLATLAFLPALGQGFVTWDDSGNFVRNPDFGPISLSRVRWAWSTFWMGVYQPLSWMLLETEAALWGLDARGYHAASIALHGANAAAFYFLAVTLLRRCDLGARARGPRAARTAAGLSALLFALHPLRVEAVAWASCQPYLPAILAALLATLAYLRAHTPDRPGRTAWAGAAWGLYVVSLLFKAETAPLPGALLVVDVYPLRRLGPGRWGNRRAWLEKLAYAAVGFVALGVAVRARASVGALATGEGSSPRLALGMPVVRGVYALGFHLVRTVWPVGLSIFDEPPDSAALPFRSFWPPLLATALATSAAVALWRRRPGITAAWAAYAALLSPHLGLVRTGPALTADRYSYLATLPLAVLLAAGLAVLLARGRRPAALAVVACLGVTGVLAAASWTQCRTWRSSVLLFETAVARGGSRNAAMYANLGGALIDANRTAEAEGRLRTALELDPHYGDTHYNLGLIRLRQGRFVESATRFQAALAANPADPDAQANAALALARQGRRADAAEHYARALELRPTADSAFRLAMLWNELEKLDRAARCYALAARLRPGHAPTHNNLGAVLGKLGRFAEAEAQFAAALRLRPDYAQARAGLELARRKRLELAEPKAEPPNPP